VKGWQTIREALNLHTDISNQKGMGWAESEWGQTYMALNDQSHARECFIRAKVTADQLDSLPLKAEIDKNLANFYFDEGLLQKGAELLDKSEALCKKIFARETQAEVLLARVRYALIIGDLKLARENVQEANAIIESHDLRRLKPSLSLSFGELLMAEGKLDAAAKIFDETSQLAKKLRQRRVRAEALLGLVQAQRKQKSASQLSLMLYYIEKDVRAISSRKLKAKFLVIKGLVAYMANGFIDSRLFAQALQVLDSTGLIVVKKQILSLLSELYSKEGKTREWKEQQDALSQLLEKNPIDLHIVHQRKEQFDTFPVSLVS
jgi:tetratricopeptide (TPR) repeat protein